VSEDLKKRRRRRRIEAYALSISVLAALLTTAGVVATGVQAAKPAGHALAATANFDWIEGVNAKLGDLDFGWLKLTASGKFVTVSGEANSAAIKEAALKAAEAEIAAVSPDILVVDNISIRGGPTAMGQALAALGPSPTVDDCNTAFAQTLSGRFIGFESGSAAITVESGRLLNALSAVAVKCQQWNIEVAGHTDLRGAPEPNQVLSQARAEAVRNYLAARGVPGDILKPVGYGQARPLAQGRSAAADAQNRRIEFTVSAR
jgi:outer membrane protein OmpA-like peptidoglycan-associated protein